MEIEEDDSKMPISIDTMLQALIQFDQKRDQIKTDTQNLSWLGKSIDDAKI